MVRFTWFKSGEGAKIITMITHTMPIWDRIAFNRWLRENAAFTAEHINSCTNRQLLNEFRQLIFDHAWVLPCTQRKPFLYLGEPSRPQLKAIEYDLGEYAMELTRRGYDISKIGF